MPVPGIYFHSGSLPHRRRSRDARTDLTDHTKTTIVVYLEYLLNIYGVHGSNILLWSGGPSSQFNNRLMARFMEMSEEKHVSNIRWNFFATSHGKGAVDGVGGVLKRRAWKKVKARQVVVRNAAEFTDTVKDGECNIMLLLSTHSSLLIGGSPLLLSYGGSPPAWRNHLQVSHRVSKRGDTCSWLGILCQYDASIWVRLPVASWSKR